MYISVTSMLACPIHCCSVRGSTRLTMIVPNVWRRSWLCRRRHKHELRHTFGTLAIQRASILQVQNWLGHADIKTTQIYLRYRSHEEDAALLSEIFAIEGSAGPRQHLRARARGLS